MTTRNARKCTEMHAAGGDAVGHTGTGKLGELRYGV